MQILKATVVFKCGHYRDFHHIPPRYEDAQETMQAGNPVCGYCKKCHMFKFVKDVLMWT